MILKKRPSMGIDFQLQGFSNVPRDCEAKKSLHGIHYEANWHNAGVCIRCLLRPCQNPALKQEPRPNISDFLQNGQSE